MYFVQIAMEINVIRNEE